MSKTQTKDRYLSLYQKQQRSSILIAGNSPKLHEDLHNHPKSKIKKKLKNRHFEQTSDNFYLQKLASSQGKIQWSFTIKKARAFKLQHPNRK